MSPPVRAVIFDLDGTLLDHIGAVTTALQGWLPTLGAERTDRLVAAWLDAEERHLPAWRAGEISFAEQRRRRLREFLPHVGVVPDDDEALDALFAGYLVGYEAAWTQFDDFDPTLLELGRMGLPVAVLTNGSTAQQRAKVRAVGLDDLRVFPSETLGAAKPDPRTYLTVCTRLEMTPGSVVHVGDCYDLDVLAPRAAGLQAIHLDRRDTGPMDEEHRITSLRHLPDKLRRGLVSRRPGSAVPSA